MQFSRIGFAAIAALAVVLCARSAVAEAQIFITGAATLNSGVVAEYSLSGATINASSIPNLPAPHAMAAAGGELFISHNSGGIGSYTQAGATINDHLIGITQTGGIAASGTDIYATDVANERVGHYTTSGATVNAGLITGLDDPSSIVLAGDKLFVAYIRSSGYVIGEYTTLGAVVNSNLITGLHGVGLPNAIAISGDKLFIAQSAGGSSGRVSEYTTSGQLVADSLISGFGLANIAFYGDRLFLADAQQGKVAEYTTSGQLVNASFITTNSGSPVYNPFSIAIVPEPSTFILAVIGLTGLAAWGQRRRKR